MKNTTAIIRQIVEMAHPIYETICKALCSAFDISQQRKVNQYLKPQQQCLYHTLWHPQQTCSPPATSTSTAKLVRWVLWHCTDVIFPTVMLSVVVIPSVTQLPEPTLCRQQDIYSSGLVKSTFCGYSLRTHGSEKFQYVHLYLLDSFTWCINVSNVQLRIYYNTNSSIQR